MIGDICSVLIENSEMDINAYAEILLPPIINKWNLLDDLDEGLLSILECLYYLISVCYNDYHIHIHFCLMMML